MRTVIPLRRHGKDPDNCPECSAEGRQYFGRPFVDGEVGPSGPTSYGKSTISQIGDSFGRRFADLSGPNGRWAVVDVVFYVDEACGLGPAIFRETRYTVCRAMSDPAGTATWTASVHERAVDDEAPTEQRARELCEAFDPAVLNWNGVPNGQLRCELVPQQVRGWAWVVECRSHFTRSRDTAPSLERATAEFLCDKGARWVFLVDTGTREAPRPELVDLGGLAELLRRSIESRAYGDDADMPQVWLYTAAGQLQPLTCQPVPHRVTDQHLVDGEDRKPVVLVTDYEIVGPHPNQSPARRLRYAEFTVAINGDA